eukprot:CAMPEP_0198535816 /NCGR_PEP_ID=MMETSP1462-20131121/39914_1 /TAXON_ID=1333877 /ORGANISM="Brandtodinium nutriculum, Strain RCC3387" /LENGTH=214 /DNA_ID=CAMNT_0044265761 /DNA_START=104 /DNA_END=746 /DNA_ORIENTATION=-
MPDVESAEVAPADALKALQEPIVVDARDPEEVEKCKGGAAVADSINVPFNVEGQKQSERPTTAEEYAEKLKEAGCLPEDKGAAVITHCGAGGRGGKACTVIKSLGYTNVHNGGSPDNIRAARAPVEPGGNAQTRPQRPSLYVCVDQPPMGHWLCGDDGSSHPKWRSHREEQSLRSQTLPGRVGQDVCGQAVQRGLPTCGQADHAARPNAWFHAR